VVRVPGTPLDWGMRVSLWFLPLAGSLLTANSLAAQTSKWRLVETQDELSGDSVRDKRLILRADGWTTGGATLVVVCGDRIPGDAHRTMLFNAGEPLEPFGGEARAYVEVSFDGGRGWERHYWSLTERASTPVAYVGDEGTPFSVALFVRLQSARTAIVRYRVIGGDRTARFDLTGLRDELRHLSACTWPAPS